VKKKENEMTIIIQWVVKVENQNSLEVIV